MGAADRVCPFLPGRVQSVTFRSVVVDECAQATEPEVVLCVMRLLDMLRLEICIVYSLYSCFRLYTFPAGAVSAQLFVWLWLVFVHASQTIHSPQWYNTPKTTFVRLSVCQLVN